MTDYQDKFSKDVGSFLRSPVREIFKKVDLNSIYSFAGGYPCAETFPMEEIREAMIEVLETYGSKSLQYGATQGVPELREALASRYKVPIDRVQITSSSQQGIDVCARIFVDPGDIIITSSPTYLGALQSFSSYRADVRGVENREADVLGVENRGSDVRGIENGARSIEEFKHDYEKAINRAIFEGKKVKFIYMIPDFQNPSGESLSLEERKVLVELAEKYDFLIVEDSPYRELRYEGEHLPTIYSLSPDRVIHLGSFSKIIAPGFRLGWAIAHPEILDKIYVCKQALDLCPPIFNQYVIAILMNNGVLDRNLLQTVNLYRSKRDLLLSLLEKYMPKGVTWTHPDGGLFIFLTLPEGFDAIQFYDKALEAGVAYVAGTFFAPDGSKLNTMRLNFSFLSEDRMEEGIKLLASLL